MSSAKSNNNSQLDRFKNAAREIEADESEDAYERSLR